MKWRNSVNQYGWLAAGMHWIMLVLLIAVYASMELRELYPKGSDPREALKSLHYMLGLVVLALVAIRIAINCTNPVPAILPPPGRVQMIVAGAVKASLYLLMLAMPLLGWALLSAEAKPLLFIWWNVPPLLNESKPLAELIEEIHEAGAYIGYWLVGLHALAGLYHHFVVRDNTLRRMWRG